MRRFFLVALIIISFPVLAGTGNSGYSIKTRDEHLGADRVTNPHPGPMITPQQGCQIGCAAVAGAVGIAARTPAAGAATGTGAVVCDMMCGRP